VNLLKKIVPSFIKPYLSGLYKFLKRSAERKEIIYVRDFQLNLVKTIQKKEIINVIFIALHDSVWKYQKLYELLENDQKFRPQIVIVPVVTEAKIDWENYNKTLNYFKTNNYNFLETYDKKKDKWLDINKLTNPDLVFFTNPHKLTFDKYYITNFKDKLTCYSPYAFVVIHLIEMHYNQKFHKLIWKYFLETKHHQKYLFQFNKEYQNNGFISGFPGLDKIFDNNYKADSVWKKTSEDKTWKIIWAPHHTITGQDSGLNYSSFETYQEFFLELLDKRKDIQIAFKPHPLLKNKLYKKKKWGKNKTDEYYNSWKTSTNGQLEESNYIDLFYTSDAMILDSASFIVEYLFFNKPILFTMKDDKVKERFNSFGKEVFNYLYTAKKKEDLEEFIEYQVFKGDDFMREERNNFLQKEVLPKNGKTASENIYHQIKKELC